MRYSLRSSLVLLIGLFPAACLSAGCGTFFGCEADATCKPTDAGTGAQAGSGGSAGAGGAGGDMACPDDPLSGDVNENCGIWASSSRGDDGNPGTQDRPVKTLSKGIALAGMELKKGGRGHLYACGETYAEVVVLPDGVSLFGGFDCSKGWKYVGFDKRAVIEAPPALAALTLPASEKESQIADVKIVASDAQESGGSSIAVLALAGSKAAFRRVEVVAGNGADGADGDDGSHDGQPAQKGLTGNDGADACTLEEGLGGAVVTTQCDDDTQSSGGEGGDGSELAANAGGDGFPAPDPNPQLLGAGGPGQAAALGAVCKGGTNGAHGKDGDHGGGGFGFGRLTKDGYIGVPGGDGTPGKPGQGGGGGGASLGNAMCGAAPHGGSGGGSGGSGGCGGKSGKGGQAGGSSIGVALLSAGLREQDMIIRSGNGGNGGNGGVLQLAGQGGLPGYGGIGFVGPGGALNGCAGGVGGHGGDGGSGGGGTGGHSVAIAYTEDNQLKRDGLTTSRGNFGLGGKGGAPAKDGDHGVTSDTFPLPP
jgi:hypothetical protein